MPVDSKKVQGRRRLRYRSFEEVIADAERLQAQNPTSLGNWSLGQALKHLGLGMHGSIDGPPFKVPRWIQVVGRVALRPMLIHWRFPPGFKLPRRAAEKLIPAETSYEDGLKWFRSGVARLEREQDRVSHPVIGRMTPAQWNKFHLRHCELHLSFFQPQPAAVKQPAETV